MKNSPSHASLDSASQESSARCSIVLVTAIAPLIWGSSYFVITEFLPNGFPITVAMLRALPAGLLLLLIVRRVPNGSWWWRSLVLGALNFSIFWTLLFISAYRLPGGVVATITAVQPLIVIVLARRFLGTAIFPASIVAALSGLGGVGLLVLTPAAPLDLIGIAAALGGAVSMAFGTVLSRLWQPPVSALTFSAWQLTAGGFLLLPVSLMLEPSLPSLDMRNIAGFFWLCLIGAALTYTLWFRGVARLGPSVVSSLGFLSPLMAVAVGWLFLGQTLTLVQIAGAIIVIGSIWLSQRAQGRRAASLPGL